MSAMRKKEIDTTSGKTNIKMPWALACRALGEDENDPFEDQARSSRSLDGPPRLGVALPQARKHVSARLVRPLTDKTARLQALGCDNG